MWRGPTCSAGARQKIIILARSYNYQTQAYYCALLAEARGHRVLPSVETMLDLRSRAHYEHALPELEEALNRELKRRHGEPPKRCSSRSGVPETPASSASRSFSSTGSAPPRSPSPSSGNGWHFIQKIELTPLSRCSLRAEGVLRRCAQGLYGPQMAGAQAALGAAPLDRRALRSEGAAAAEHARDADALGQARRPARGRGGADHAQGSRPAGGVRRAVHPRDDLDPQPHLPLRPARHDGAHAGHRRSDLDDPLHQQGLSLGAAHACRAAGAGHDRHPGAGRRRCASPTRSAFRSS